MWTLEALKTHFDALREADQRALDAALAAVKEENRKTEMGAEKRFEILNELRGDVATQQQLESIEKRVSDHQSRLDTIQGRDSGKDISWGKLLGAAGFISTLLGIFYVLST